MVQVLRRPIRTEVFGERRTKAQRNATSPFHTRHGVRLRGLRRRCPAAGGQKRSVEGLTQTFPEAVIGTGRNTFQPSREAVYVTCVSAGCSILIQCAVQRHGLLAGVRPARQLSLRPVAIGAVAEVTKRLKPSVQRVAFGRSASWQAITRVNAEQVPKILMRRPTRSESRGRLPWPGKRATNAPDQSAGILAMGCQRRKTDATREALCRGRDERPTSYPRGTGWVAQGGGEARSTGEAG